MACKFCNGDEELVMRSSFVNGEVKHSQICLNCLWPLLFININDEGEDGKVLPKGKAKRELYEKQEPSVLQDRFKPGRQGKPI